VELGEHCRGDPARLLPGRGDLGVAIWALAAPSEYDPQQGMAIGFIIPVALVLGGLLLLLWRAVVRGQRWLVWTIFVLAAYPAVMLAAQFVYEHFFHTPA